MFARCYTQGMARPSPELRYCPHCNARHSAGRSNALRLRLPRASPSMWMASGPGDACPAQASRRPRGNQTALMVVVGGGVMLVLGWAGAVFALPAAPSETPAPRPTCLPSAVVAPSPPVVPEPTPASRPRAHRVGWSGRAHLRGRQRGWDLRHRRSRVRRHDDGGGSMSPRSTDGRSRSSGSRCPRKARDARATRRSSPRTAGW